MIRGRKSRLRAIEQTDASEFHSWINDEETNQWRGLHHPTSKEEAVAWIEKARIKTPESIGFSIETNEGKLIGFVGLQSVCSRSRRAEVWIYIGSRDHWGSGYGEDVTRSLCKYAFEQMNLHRIWLECNPAFKNVIHCYEKVGFKQEGKLRDAYYRDGTYHDTCIMGLLNGEIMEPKEA